MPARGCAPRAPPAAAPPAVQFDGARNDQRQHKLGTFVHPPRRVPSDTVYGHLRDSIGLSAKARGLEEDEMTTDHQPAYSRTHELSGDVLAFVLGPEIDALRARASAASDGRAAKTLVKEGALRVTLVALKTGVRLQEHEVAGPVLVQGLGGIARLAAGSGEVEVGPGALVALDEGVAHSVQAVEDCELLITIVLAPKDG